MEKVPFFLAILFYLASVAWMFVALRVRANPKGGFPRPHSQGLATVGLGIALGAGAVEALLRLNSPALVIILLTGLNYLTAGVLLLLAGKRIKLPT